MEIPCIPLKLSDFFFHSPMSTTSTVQLATTGRDNDPADAEPSTASVSLHRLCEKCRTFFDRWEALQCIRDSHQEVSQEVPDTFFFCTTAHLLDFQHACHSCKFFQGSLDRWPFVQQHSLQHKNVYFHTQRNVGGVMTVYALFGSEQPTAKEEGHHFASFALETYRGMQ